MAPVWNEAKRLSNIAKHGVDFTLVLDFEWESAIVMADRRRDYGEARFVATGFIGERLHKLVFAERGRDMRIISLRRANRREVRDYEKAL